MLAFRIGMFLFSLPIIMFLFGCEKNPETIVKAVTITDTIYITRTDTLSITQFIQDTATTFILSRHTETTGIGADPGLSTIGQERATELARVLKNTKIHAVFSTNYNRTRETAFKIASNNALSTQIYDPAKLDELTATIFKQYKTESFIFQVIRIQQTCCLIL